MNTISIFKATLMKRVLIALALFACIGTSVMAQTYRPLTGTRLLLNSTYPAGGRLTLQASPSSDYTLTLPSSSPAANSVLVGSTSGSFVWSTFSNGLTASASDIKLGGSLTANTTIDVGTRIFKFNSSSVGSVDIAANLNVKATDGSIELESPTAAVNTTAQSVTIANPSSLLDRSEFYLDQDESSLKLFEGGTLKGLIGMSWNGSDAIISLEASQMSLTGNLVPALSNNYDLGSDADRWKAAYIGNSDLHIGSTAGATELAVGYNTGTNTAYFNVDNVTNVLTLHATNGAVSNLALTVGNGDATDVITVNSDNLLAENLQIKEDQISRNQVLKIQGSDGTLNSSQITLDNSLDISTDDGDITVTAGAAGSVEITTENGIDLESTSGTQSSKVSLSTTQSIYQIKDGVQEAGVTLSNPGGYLLGSFFGTDGTNESSVQVLGGTDGTVIFNTVSSERMRIASDGNVGIGVSAPSALLDVAAGTASTAAVKLTNGTLLTTPEANAVEWDGTNLHVTDVAATRYVVAKGLTATRNYDFGSLTQNCETTTVTVTGAALGDVVSIGVPAAAAVAGVTFTAWVSAADVVSIRCCAVTAVAADPAAGDFKVFVTKY